MILFKERKGTRLRCKFCGASEDNAIGVSLYETSPSIGIVCCCCKKHLKKYLEDETKKVKDAFEKWLSHLTAHHGTGEIDDSEGKEHYLKLVMNELDL